MCSFASASRAGADFCRDLNSSSFNEATDFSWIWKPIEEQMTRYDKESVNTAKHSILQEIVRKDWHGVLYLMLEKLKLNGSTGVIPGIEAAVKTGHLNLAKKLIEGVQGNQETQLQRSSLLHTLAQYAPSDEESETQAGIPKLLFDKQVNLQSIDSNGSTALIHASIERNAQLCSALTSMMNIKNLKPDNFNRTPLSAHFWKPVCPTDFLENLKSWAENFDEINVLSKYPITLSQYPAVRYLRTDPSSNPAAQFSPLIMAVLYGNYGIVRWLLTSEKFKAQVDINFPDSLGRTALCHAVRLNDIKLIKLLLNPEIYNYETDVMPATTGNEPLLNSSGLNVNCIDSMGWSPIHHLVAPISTKSSIYYCQAEAILKLLISVGARLNIQDSIYQETPLQLALRMKNFPLAKLLGTGTGTELKVYEAFPAIEDAFQRFPNDFELEAMNRLLESENSGTDELEQEIIPDALSGYTKENSIVVRDEVREVPLDCLLTKLDLSYGIHGIYNFFKMQLIKETNGLGLVVLFTRSGRVGAKGNYKKTPFPTEADGMTAFKEIFQAKTGNNWDELKSLTFQSFPKRYQLLDRHSSDKSKQIGKVEFDALEKQSKLLTSQLSSPVFELIQKLALEHKSVPIGDGPSPFGSLSRTTLVKAEGILEKISKLIAEREKLDVNQQRDQVQKIADSIVQLSEEYFTLVPNRGYAFEKITPLLCQKPLRKQQEIVLKLLRYEYGHQLLLGAQFHQLKINPYDYMYSCLGTKLEILNPASEETQLILEYIHNTADSKVAVEGIFRIEIPGAEKTLNVTGIPNRHLLWHGTQGENLLSILHSGLKVEPLGYKTHGCTLFEKGIYFGDMFGKSIKYSSNTRNQGFMLLCEVALGNVQDVYVCGKMDDEETLKPENHSLKTRNSKWQPLPSASVYWKGRTIPLGPKCQNVSRRGRIWTGLQ